MAGPKTFVYGLLLVILLVLAFRLGPSEAFSVGLADSPPPASDVLSAVAATAVPGSAPSVKLYEGPFGRGLAYEFTPQTSDVSEGYMRLAMPLSLQSLDINLPLVDPAHDPQRYVRIWALYGDDTLASSESGFYNIYTEPDWAHRANPAKYRLVAAVAAGERLVANVGIRVRRVLIECNLL